jgi:hypothetical protein
LGVMRLIFDDDCESMSGDEDFFSVARTIPLVAEYGGQLTPCNRTCCIHIPLMPSEVTPWLTAFRAYSEARLVCEQSVLRVLSRRTDLHQLSAMFSQQTSVRQVGNGWVFT